MFQVMRIGNERLELDIAGKLDREGMREGLSALFTQAQGMQHGQLLMRVGDLEMPTAGAVGVELSHLPQLFRLIRQFDRCAVLSAREWIRTMSEIEGAMIPGLEVKSFSPEQDAEALAWLSGVHAR
ncbi:SpoIIAA-like [Halopseudomonas litoralis]|uniref:SpoIIAA-like n=1 Tax=Halopseudomonas litoralis TaxID=797277 RepID=A0A1H1L3H6_9GAMM|nr:STAS/SEC14 domain-containing protein [Halopseudomonas litoralis]SDR69086.1 SpoIIAA-like [Halopseudomonas litoralis]